MEKVYGLSPKDLHIDLAKQRFRFLSASVVLRSLLKGVLRRKSNILPPIFPEAGTGSFYEALRNEIENGGHPIFLNSFPTKVIHERNHIKSIKVQINQRKEV
jgi:hypothetical protein